jgi:hypothetical protein
LVCPTNPRSCSACRFKILECDQLSISSPCDRDQLIDSLIAQPSHRTPSCSHVARQRRQRYDIRHQSGSGGGMLRRSCRRRLPGLPLAELGVLIGAAPPINRAWVTTPIPELDGLRRPCRDTSIGCTCRRMTDPAPAVVDQQRQQPIHCRSRGRCRQEPCLQHRPNQAPHPSLKGVLEVPHEQLWRGQGGGAARCVQHASNHAAASPCVAGNARRRSTGESHVSEHALQRL